MHDAVICDGVVKIYQTDTSRVQAVKGVDLRVPPGSTLAITGPSGSGKSTLIEAIANLSRFPVGGGSRQELANPFGPGKESELAQELSPVFVKRPRDGYFFRAEFYAEFATLLDEPQATEFLFATSIPDLPIAS